MEDLSRLVYCMYLGKSKKLTQSGAPLVLLADIRLGWKGLPGKNTRAYF
jgi:hypothetical protein